MPRLLCSIAAFVAEVVIVAEVVVFVEKSGAILLARGRLMLHYIDLAGIDAVLHVSSIDHC